MPVKDKSAGAAPIAMQTKAPWDGPGALQGADKNKLINSRGTNAAAEADAVRLLVL